MLVCESALLSDTVHIEWYLKPSGEDVVCIDFIYIYIYTSL